ncbi:hypothetical protein L1D54_22255 [Vibrio brasiliensis]|jgi:hypothetical protein|uniref:hypothetical protein n=1 Tax=Vibrio brasiliensis TaxID=170652 RepID=UPI001EFE5731|nr:hypothetical protein [Vibrio brasiliensis]MCG9651242.1 hypothetical protein [Vibrio brasiliensis]MCG9727144.1 hypothetical protein [Vibrio brasiliensis]MCG9753167.1 hypothetical protein [Vibrio brasiliensis]|tara:strand:- start:731 stop:1393 length:663 start_codon:yes stop_codon:yes gene_type:complete
MKTIKLCLALFSVIVLSGCVSPISLEEQSPNPSISHQDNIVISVLDNRARLIEEEKPNHFVGTAHGSFGIPFDWHVEQILATEDGDKDKNLAQFIEHRLTTGFKESGWNATEAGVESIDSDEKALEILKSHNADKLLVINIREWYFSINLNWVTAFNFDTDSIVSVYEVQDGKIVEKRFQDRDVIEEKADESPQNNVLRAYRDQLVEIVTDPEIQAALEK